MLCRSVRAFPGTYTYTDTYIMHRIIRRTHVRARFLLLTIIVIIIHYRIKPTVSVSVVGYTFSTFSRVQSKVKKKVKHKKAPVQYSHLSEFQLSDSSTHIYTFSLL